MTNPEQFGQERFRWSGYGLPGGEALGLDYSTGYLPDLLNLRAAQKAGTLSAQDRQRYQTLVQQAQAIPLRDVAGLTYDAGGTGTGTSLSGASPDLGGIMLRLADRIDAGQATDQERGLFQETERLLRDQNWRASVPQPSDAWNPMGDQFFGALGVLGLGATGGLAAAPLFAGGASLATTLGSLGTLSGIAGTGAGVLGQALDAPLLSKIGLGLGAAGGIAGGLGGLSNLWSSGVQSLGDAARLASHAGRVVGGVGAMADSDALRQAGGWLGTAGHLGGGVENLSHLLSGQGGSLQGVLGLVKPLQRIAGQFLPSGGRPAPARPMAGQPMARPPAAAPQQPLASAPAGGAASAPAPGGGAGGIQALLQAAHQAQQQGRTLTDADWLRPHWRLRNPAARSVLSNL